MSDSANPTVGPMVEGTYTAKGPAASTVDPVDGMTGRAPLTPAEAAELRKAAAEGGAAMRAFWAKRAAGQPAADQPANGQAAGAGTDTDTPTATEGAAVDPVKLNTHVQEVSEGRTSGAEFGAVERLGRGVAEQLATLDQAGLDAAHNKTMAEVYRGDVEAYADGMADITVAAYRLCRGDATKAKELLAEIDRQRVLAHPGTHHKILNLARQIIGKRGSVFARPTARDVG